MREEKIAPPSAFPISLTSKERKRLAKEARALAMECLTNGPEMRDSWCGCSIGIVMNRAGLWAGSDLFDEPNQGTHPDAAKYQASCALATDLEILVSGVWGDMLLSSATRERIARKNPTAVVFPLLALADEIEALSDPDHRPSAEGEKVVEQSVSGDPHAK